MNSDSQLQPINREGKPAVTPIFGLPLGDSDSSDAPAERVRLHLPQIKVEANGESFDQWHNLGRNKTGDESTMAEREMEAALQLLVERAIRATGGASAAIIALPRGGVLSRCFVAGVEPERCHSILRATSQLFAESVRTRQVILINDAVADAGGGEACEEVGVGATAVMPLLRDQEIRGRIEVFSPDTGAFAEGDLTTIERIGNAAQVALDLAEAAGIRLEVLLAQEVASSTKAQIDDSAAKPEPTQNETTATGGSTDDLAIGPATKVVNKVSEGQQERVDLVPELPIQNPPSEALPQSTTIQTYVTGSDTKADQEIQRAEMPAAAGFKATEAATATTSKAKTRTEPQLAVAKKPDATSKAGGIQNCQGCGFPVSEGRLFCLNCQPAEPSETDAATMTDGEATEAMPAFLLPEREPAAEGALAVLKNPLMLGGAAMLVLILVVLLLSRAS
jgi:hypothetical protein